MLICVFLLYFCANNYRVCLILKEFLNLGLLSLNHLFLYYDNTQFVLVQVLLGKAHQCNLHITGQNITSIAIYYFCLGCKLYVWTYQYSWNVYEWCKQETVVVYCLWCDNTKHYFRCGWWHGIHIWGITSAHGTTLLCHWKDRNKQNRGREWSIKMFKWRTCK